MVNLSLPGFEPKFPDGVRLWDSLATDCGDDEAGDEDSASKIIGVFSLTSDGDIHSLIVSPSGLAYIFDNDWHNRDFLSFALRYYDVRTANLDTREALAKMAGIDVQLIKGSTHSRRRGQGIDHTSLFDLSLLFFPHLKAPLVDLFENSTLKVTVRV